MCFFEWNDDDDDRWMACCGEMHAYLGMFMFVLVDVGCVGVTLAVYLWYALDDPQWHNLVPVAALCVSAIFIPLGILALITQKVTWLRVYGLRVLLVVLFCIGWMCAGLFLSGWIFLVWFLGALVYLYGYSLTQKTIVFFDVNIECAYD